MPILFPAPQPRTQPELRPGLRNARFLYLPSLGFLRAREYAGAIGAGTPTLVQKNDAVNLRNNNAHVTFANTRTLDFTSGMTIIAVGMYTADSGDEIMSLVNRADAGSAGGFSITLYNRFGGPPPRIWSSYNKPSVGDTNFDSIWVNDGATITKDTTGNGSYATVADKRYTVAFTTATGPAAHASSDIRVGQSSTTDVNTFVEFVIIIPRKLTEQEMRAAVMDPYGFCFADEEEDLDLAVAAAALDTRYIPGGGIFDPNIFDLSIFDATLLQQTLGGLSQTATAAGVVKATATQTLGALTQAATVAAPALATAAQTLGSVTQAATVADVVKATGAQTLATVTQAATAALVVKATGAQTLGTVTQAATVSAEGPVVAATQTLGSVTQAATSAVTVKATAAHTLSTVTQAATVTTAAPNLVATQTLATVAQAATATVGLVASAAQTLGTLAQVATGGTGRTLAATQTLGTLTQVAAAIGSMAAVATQTLGTITQAATGAVRASVPGEGAFSGGFSSGFFTDVLEQTLGSLTQSAQVSLSTLRSIPGAAGTGEIASFYPSTLYGMRRRKIGYAGPCIRVYNATTTVQTDIGFKADGWIDEVALAVCRTGAEVLRVTTWYDQSGGGVHATQASAGAMPRIIDAAGVVDSMLGHPAIYFGEGGHYLEVAATAAFGVNNGAFTVEAFAQGGDVADGVHWNAICDFRSATGAGWAFPFFGFTGQVGWYNGSIAGNAGVGIADNTAYHFAWSEDAAGVNLRQYIDGMLQNGPVAATIGAHATRPLWIGETREINATHWPGVIGEWAFVLGANQYPSAFAPRSYTVDTFPAVLPQALATVTQTATASASQRSLTAAQTLAAITGQAVAVVVNVAAAAAQALDPVAQAATAAATVKATATQTLGALTQTATATGRIAATATQTLGALTQTATATGRIAATATQTLGTVAQLATANHGGVDVLAVQTLGTVTQAATATGRVAAAAAQTLGTVAQAAAAAAPGLAAATQTLGGVTQSATATYGQLSATGTQTLGSVAQSAATTARVSAAAAQSLAAVVQAAAATVLARLSATQTLGGVSQVATVAPPGALSAEASQTLGAVAQSAVAFGVIGFTGAQTLGAVIQLALLQREYAFERNERTYDVLAEDREVSWILHEDRSWTVTNEDRED